MNPKLGVYKINPKKKKEFGSFFEKIYVAIRMQKI
jgi:hypothetical protein